MGVVQLDLAYVIVGRVSGSRNGRQLRASNPQVRIFRIVPFASCAGPDCPSRNQPKPRASGVPRPRCAYRPQIQRREVGWSHIIVFQNHVEGECVIHGELLKLGFELAQSSVAKYMVKRRGPPSQGWRTFLGNHAPDIAAMDLFVVPTIGFNLLSAFVIIRLDRRNLVWINVTTNPTAEWIAHQMTEAFPWDEAPRYLIRDRDRIYGTIVTRRLRAMGIRDKGPAPEIDIAQRNGPSAEAPGPL